MEDKEASFYNKFHREDASLSVPARTHNAADEVDSRDSDSENSPTAYASRVTDNAESDSSEPEALGLMTNGVESDLEKSDASEADLTDHDSVSDRSSDDG